MQVPVFVQVSSGFIIFAGMVEVEVEENESPKCSCNFGPGCSIHDHSLVGYLSRVTALFEIDPARGKYQRGYFDALTEIAKLIDEGKIIEI